MGLRQITIMVLSGLMLITSACSRASGSLANLPTDQAQGEFQAIALPTAWTPTVSATFSPSTATRPAPSTEFASGGNPPRPRNFLPPTQIVTAVSPGPNYTGWQRVETNLAAFMLPGRFEVLDLGSSFSELFGAFAGGMIEGMSDLAQEFADEAMITPTPIDISGLDEALAFDFLLAVDTDQLTSVILFSQPIEGNPSLALVMEETLDGFEGALEILVWQFVVDTPIPTGRIELLINDPEGQGTGKVLIYVYRGETRTWSLMFQTDAGAFALKLNEFEAVAASFEPG